MSNRNRKHKYRNPRIRGKLRRMLVNMQTLHGKIKGVNYPKNVERIMELGAGKLNDLLNWAHSGIKKVYAIEIDRSSIEEGNNKYEFYKNKRSKQLKYKTTNKLLYEDLKKKNKLIPDLPEIEYIQADLTNSDDIDRIIEYLVTVKESIDHIICNFAIHYFMEDKKTVSDLIRLINYFLKVGGTFRFTTIDGKLLYEAFSILCSKPQKIGAGSAKVEKIDKLERKEKKKYIDKLVNIIDLHTSNVTKKSKTPVYVTDKRKNMISYKNDDYTLFRMKRLYPCDESFLKYGQKISVYVISIGRPHYEYLVNIEYLTKKFGSYGYQLSDFKRFQEYMDEYINKKKIVKPLSQAEFKYSSLNVYVSYVKTISSIM